MCLMSVLHMMLAVTSVKPELYFCLWRWRGYVVDVEPYRELRT